MKKVLNRFIIAAAISAAIPMLVHAGQTRRQTNKVCQIPRTISSAQTRKLTKEFSNIVKSKTILTQMQVVRAQAIINTLQLNERHAKLAEKLQRCLNKTQVLKN